MVKTPNNNNNFFLEVAGVSLLMTLSSNLLDSTSSPNFVTLSFDFAFLTFSVGGFSAFSLPREYLLNSIVRSLSK